MPSNPSNYEPEIEKLIQDICSCKDRKEVSNEFQFDNVAETGVLKGRPFKDTLIFKSENSKELFTRTKDPFKDFNKNGEGLPLFAFRTKAPFFSKPGYLGFIFYRYEILKNGEAPESSDYQEKGKCDGFTMFKIPFCSVFVMKKSYYKTNDKISHIIDLQFGEAEQFRKYRLVRCSGIRSAYLLENGRVILKWVFTSKRKFNLDSSLFTIKAAIGRTPEVSDNMEDIPSFDWDSCPTVGCMCRTTGSLFDVEPPKESFLCPHIFLGRSGPPGYNEFSVPWLTKLIICVSVLINSLENTGYLNWVQDN